LKQAGSNKVDKRGTKNTIRMKFKGPLFKG